MPDLVKLVIDRTGSLVRVSAEAPAGKVWSASGVHELVAEARGTGATAAAKADVRERMALGTYPCPDLDCDWCADAEAAGE